MKLVDVPDSKSGVVHPTCRFDSGHRQIKRDTNVSLFIWLMQELNPKRQLYRFGASELRLKHFCVCANSTLAKCGMPLHASEQDTPAIGIFYCANAVFAESNLLRLALNRYGLRLSYSARLAVLSSRKTILNRFARQSGHRQIKRDTNVSLFIWLMQELNPKAAALSV